MPDEPRPKSRSFASAAKLGAKVARLDARYKAEAKARLEAETKLAEMEKRPPADQLVKERDEARGQLRSRDHRAAFDKVAADLKVRGKALDDVWSALKLDTTTDTPDDAAIKTALEGHVKERDWLIESETPAPKLERGQGSERGGKAPAVGGMRVTRDQLSDPQWMSHNQEAYATACADGSLQIVR